MKNIVFKMVSCLLFVAIIVSLIPASGNMVLAAEDNSISWSFDEAEGALRIDGSGEMPDYSDSSAVPWGEHRNEIISVEISDGITAVGNFAFYGCERMNYISIPQSVTRIGASAFAYCFSLNEIYLSEYVTEIGLAAFTNDTALNSIHVSEENNYYTSVDGVLFDKSMSVLIAYPTGKIENSYAIPDGVAVIDQFAFFGCSSLTRLDIPKQVTDIKDMALAFTRNLTEIYYGGTMDMWEAITYGNGWDNGIAADSPDGEWVLYYNAAVDEFVSGVCGDKLTWSLDTVKKELTISGTGKMYDYTDRSAPWKIYRNHIISAKIENGVTSIGAYAFRSCGSLVSVSIGETVDSIGTGAFYECIYLAVMNIPNSVNTIESHAFYYCINLSTLYIPVGLTRIDDYTFYACKSLKSLNLSENITSIGAYALAHCDAFATLNYAGSVAQWELIEKGNKWDYNAGKSNESGIYELNCKGGGEDDEQSGSCGSDAQWSFSYATGKLTISGTGNIDNRGAYDSWGELTDHITTVEIGNGITAIGDNAFSLCESLTTVSLPASLLSIGNNAFWFCGALTEITLPKRLQTVGDKAFQGCEALESISVPKNLKSIGSGAFSYCTNLAEVYFPGTEYKWNNIAKGDGWDTDSGKGTANKTYTITFGNESDYSGTCGDNLTWELWEDTGLLKVSGNGAMADWASASETPWYKHIGIIKTIELDEKITSIGAFAFYNCTALSSISLHEGIASIGERAFYGCSMLDNVKLPQSITSLGSYVFAYCKALKNLSLPQTMKALSKYAFCGCTSLATADLPQSITHIPDGLFSSCSGLSNISLPQSVSSIGNYAFSSCSALESIRFPEKLKNVGEYAFLNCTALKNIDFSISLSYISAYAFKGCNSLVSVSLPQSLTYMEKNVFEKCTALESVSLPTNLIIISEYTFSGCSSLKNVELPANLVNMKDRAFANCTSLERIDLPSTITSIGAYAFSGCTALADIYYGGNSDKWKLVSKGSSWASKAGSATEKGTYTMHYVTENYYSGTFGEGLTWEFWDGQGTLKISGMGVIPSGTVPWRQYSDKIKSLVICEGITGVEYGVFMWNSSIESIVFPESLTSIGDHAFSGCTALKSVSLPHGLDSIGGYAFDECTALESVFIPQSLTNVGIFVFGHCDALTDVIMEEGLMCVGGYQFYNCTALREIHLPESLVSIGESAFYGCVLLGDIYYAGSSVNWGKVTKGASWNSKTGSQTEKYTYTVHYGKENYYSGVCGNDVRWELWEEQGLLRIMGTGEMYERESRSSVPWSKYAQYIKEVEIDVGVTNICSYAFYDCIGITELSLPDSIVKIGDYAFCGISVTELRLPDNVTSIGSYAFIGCDLLEKVNIPVGVNTINSGTFFNCGALDEISLPEGITTINEKAFQNCSSLASVSIPEGVTRICNYTFSGCAALKEVTLPKGITLIDKEAFKNCTALTNIYYKGNKNDWTAITKGDNWDYNTGNYKINCGEETYYTGSCGSALTWTYWEERQTLSIIGKGDMYSWNSWSQVPWYNYRGSVKKLEIGEGVTSIGKNAFYEFTSLAEASLPESLVSIGSYAFEYCYYLANINYSGSERSWSAVTKESSWDYKAGSKISAGTYTVNFGKENECLGECGEKLTWEYSDTDGRLTISGSGEMYDWTDDKSVPWYIYADEIQSIELGNGVTSIGNYAFYDCDSLQSISIPSNITRIGNLSFGFCDFLKTVVLNEGLREIDTEAFFYCPLTEINLPDSLESIGDTAFYQCSSLKKISWPGNVTVIGEMMFMYCTALEEVSIPEGVTEIGSSAFYGCTALLETSIPEGVTSIGSSAFSGCTALVKATIPKSVTSIGGSAFRDCYYLADIYYPGNEIKWNEITKTAGWDTNAGSKTTKRTYRMNYGEENYYSGVCGDNLIWEFYEKQRLLKISGSGAMDNWTESASAPWYEHVSKIYSIELSEGLTSIGDYAFYNCNSVDEISIPEGVTRIGNYAFYLCELLLTAELPKSLASIGSYAFADCDFFGVVYYAGSEWQWDSLTKGTSWDLNTYLIMQYAEANRCSGTCGDNLAWELTEADKTLRITGSGAMTDWSNGSAPWYSYKTYIKNIVIGEGVTRIGNYSFHFCSSLASVNLPESITSIGVNAFNACNMLSSVSYGGTRSDWAGLEIANGNSKLASAYGAPYINLTPSSISVTIEPGTSLILMLASYDREQLVDVKSITITEDTSLSFRNMSFGYSSGNTIKAFLWRNLTDIKPLCRGKSVIATSSSSK